MCGLGSFRACSTNMPDRGNREVRGVKSSFLTDTGISVKNSGLIPMSFAVYHRSWNRASVDILKIFLLTITPALDIG
jgi:hypothetical protein